MRNSEIGRQRATTMLLLVLTCAVAAFILMIERRHAPLTGKYGETVPVLTFEAEKVDSVIIQSVGAVIELARRQNAWTIVAPIKARADQGHVNRFLTTLENLPQQEIITKPQRQARGVTLTDYGLTTPLAHIVIGTAHRRPVTLDIGDISPLQNALYIRVDQQDEVIVTTTNLIGLLPRTLGDLRDTRLVNGTPDTVTRLEIKVAQTPTVKMVREAQEWIIQRPVIARADREKTTQLLEQIFDLRIAQFVSDTMADPVAYGLSDDEVTMQIALWSGTTDQSLKLIFGKSDPAGNLLFAAHAGVNSVYAVPRATVEALPVSFNVLRDNRLYGMAPEKIAFIAIEMPDQALYLRRTNTAWQISAPVQADAAPKAITDLLHNLNSLRVEEFIDYLAAPSNIFAPPAITVCMADTPPQGDISPIAKLEASGVKRILQLSARRPEIGGGVYARFDDEQQIARISAAALTAITADPADYRTPQVLSLEPRSVTAITAGATGATRTVERNSNNSWQDATSGALVPELTETIAKLLEVAANLRATRFERGTSVPDLARYGLDEPLFTLTFTITGAGGIRKTIVGGQIAEEQGVFAMIQGQDAVFVLNREIAELCQTFLGM